MEDLYFWKKWQTGEKAIFWILLGLVITSFVSYIYFSSIGIFNIISWDTYVDVANIPTTFDVFSRYMLDFNIDTENFLVSEYYLPSKYNTNPEYGALYFCIIAFLASTSLSAISLIPKVKWFAALTTLFVAWLTFLHLDTIGLFGIYNKSILIGSLITFVGIAFYFHAFATNISILTRFLVFNTLMAVFLYLIHSFSEIKSSLFFLSANSYFVVIGLSIIFIFIVSYDILTGIVFLNAKTRNFNPKSNITNLLALSALYLISPVLAFLEEIHAINFSISYFNLYYLLFVSTLVGLWAQKRRSVILKGNLPYQPAGAILLICLSILTFSTIAYAHATFNTSVISLFDSIILFFHVGFGVSFLIYILFNFTPALLKNIDISNTIFTPKGDLSYFFVRFLGLAIVYVMLHIKNFTFVNHTLAGYNNYKGDVAYHLDDVLMAKYFYNTGTEQNSFNAKSNYALSEIHVERQKFGLAKQHIENALFSAPHPLTYAANQYIHELNSDAFYNIWKLEEGVKAFPNSTHLKNNLAITYAKEGIKEENCIDLYTNAIAQDPKNPLLQSNLLAFCASHNLITEADSLINKLESDINSLSLNANKMAIWNALQKPSTTPEIEISLKNTNLYNSSSAYAYNATFRQLPTSVALKKKTESLIQNPNNSAYLNDLNFLKGIQLFYNKEHDLAKVQFDEILVECHTSLYPYYSNIFGLLMLKIGADDIAHEYFRKSHESQKFRKVNKSPLFYALSSSKRIETDSLSNLLAYVSIFDTTYTQYANYLSNNLKLNKSEDIVKLQDFEKVQLFDLKSKPLSKEENTTIINSIEQADLKVLAATLLMEYYLDEKDLENARYYYTLIPNTIQNRFVASKMRIQFLRMLHLTKSFDQLKQEAENFDFVEEDYFDLNLLLAQIALEKREFEKVEEYLNIIEKTSPLAIEGIILKSDYYSIYKKDIQKGYDILLEATALNPTSTELTKAYALRCLEMNLDSFAETILTDLSYDLNKEDYEAFYKEFVAKKIIAEEQFNNW